VAKQEETVSKIKAKRSKYEEEEEREERKQQWKFRISVAALALLSLYYVPGWVMSMMPNPAIPVYTVQEIKQAFEKDADGAAKKFGTKPVVFASRIKEEWDASSGSRRFFCTPEGENIAEFTFDPYDEDSPAMAQQGVNYRMMGVFHYEGGALIAKKVGISSLAEQ
jgi:hypothetical protein